MIKPILYERIEQKNEIEIELFSKLTPEEKRAAKKSWFKLLRSIKPVSKEERVQRELPTDKS